MSQAVQLALAALADYPAPPPVEAVSYTSQGRVLVLGDSAAALESARQLAETLPVHLLAPAACDPIAGVTQLRGELETLNGWLGAFQLHWRQDGQPRQQAFDLVLDLAATPHFTMHQPPQGYFAPADDTALQAALAEIRGATGEFEKPKFFDYSARQCAHSRAKLDGCHACIDVCSTQAIRPAGEQVRVEPHLCMGCGACATVCPSGAMRYDFPSMPYWSGKVKALLASYRAAGGRDACLLLHAPESAAQVAQADLPEQMIPLEVFHIASIGLDWLLGALALGAGRVAIVTSGREAPQYHEALAGQMALAETVLAGLGYGSGHFQILSCADEASLAALGALPPARIAAEPASFGWFEDKRTTLDACLEHFTRHTPAELPQALALPAGAPFGEVQVNGEKCTLCLSCVSACPASALRDGNGAPALQFVERNCVQCGLCESACPEDAIRLQPRLLLGAAAKQPRTLHRDQPFHCVNCGKPFASVHMVGSILAKLSGHSMFATPEARRRLQMCGDCRVADIVASGEPVSGVKS